MATHSSVFAWRIPGQGEPGGLPSMQSHSVRQDWSDLAAAAAAAVVSDSLWPHRLQHDRFLCPPLSPGLHLNSNSYQLSQWCYLSISSSTIPLSFCLQSFPGSGSFPMSQFFASSGQSIGVFSFSISLSNEYSGLISLRIDWFDLLAVQSTLKSLLQHHSSKASIFVTQLSLWSSSHIHTWLLEKL